MIELTRVARREGAPTAETDRYETHPLPGHQSHRDEPKPIGTALAYVIT